MIISFKTHKAEGWFVKLTDQGASMLRDADQMPTKSAIRAIIEFDYAVHSITDLRISENFEPLGLTSLLTEKQMNKIVGNPQAPCRADFTIRNSFESLMQSLEVFEVNPISKPKRKDSFAGLSSEVARDMNNRMFKVECTNWQYHQERTGNWLVLLKL